VGLPQRDGRRSTGTLGRLLASFGVGLCLATAVPAQSPTPLFATPGTMFQQNLLGGQPGMLVQDPYATYYGQQAIQPLPGQTGQIGLPYGPGGFAVPGQQQQFLDPSLFQEQPTELERYYTDVLRAMNLGGEAQQAPPQQPTYQGFPGALPAGVPGAGPMADPFRIRQFGYEIFRPNQATLAQTRQAQAQPGASPGGYASSALDQATQQGTTQLFANLARQLGGDAPMGALSAPFATGGNISGLGRSAPTDYLGSVDPSYVIGVGDVVEITMFGGRPGQYQLQVNNEGVVTLPNNVPLRVAGKSAGQVQEEIQQQIAAAFISTQAFVSVKSFRRIAVTIAGAVANPGVVYTQSLASFASVLRQSGGIEKNGSLRGLQLHRLGRNVPIDLYKMLVDPDPNVLLAARDGDYLFVPPTGATFAVAGQVGRPGIFELPAGGGLTLADGLRYAGGTYAQGAGNVMVARLGADGGRQLTKLRDGDMLRPLDVVYAVPAPLDLRNNVLVLTSARPPYAAAATDGMTLSRLLGTPGLVATDIYRFFAVLGRRTGQSENYRYYGFSPLDVARGAYDAELYSGDVVVLLSERDLKWLNSPQVRQLILRPQTAEPRRPQRETVCRGEEMLVNAVRSGSLPHVTGLLARLSRGELTEYTEEDPNRPDGRPLDSDPVTPGLQRSLTAGGQLPTAAAAGQGGRGEAAQGANQQRTPRLAVLTCPRLFAGEHAQVVLTVGEHLMSLSGSVPVPGVFPVIAGTLSVGQVVEELGGGVLSSNGGSGQVVVTQLASDEFGVVQQGNIQQVAALPLKPGMIVDLRAGESAVLGGVAVLGAVRSPGIYPITSKDTVLTMVLRAGGLRPEAYPYGGVLTRVSAREAEQRNIERYIDEVRQYLLVRSSTSSTVPLVTPATLAVLDSLATRRLYGRVVTELDPTVLQVRPELDIAIEPGDQIIIPRRVETVTVLGEVLNPGTFSFRAGQTVDQYVDRAGGPTKFADSGAVILVFPDGNARRVGVDAWNFTPVQVPPGSSIIVSRDLERLSALEALEYVSRISSQIGISLATFQRLFDDD